MFKLFRKKDDSEFNRLLEMNPTAGNNSVAALNIGANAMTSQQYKEKMRNESV